MKKEFPILEFDKDVEALIDPFKQKKHDIPTLGVLTFFNDVIKKLLSEGKIKQIYALRSEMGEHPVYEFISEESEHQSKRVLLFHSGLGAPLSVGLLEELIGLGLQAVVVCGGAGVLDGDIVRGHIIIPTKAVRDEGTSYHYLSPSRYAEPTEDAVTVLENILEKHKVPYIKGTTWTTDAYFRETKGKINLRKEVDHCITVEMEASALFAVASFRKIALGQLLYAGDDVSGDTWDFRDWVNNKSVREKLVWLAKEAVEDLALQTSTSTKTKD